MPAADVNYRRAANHVNEGKKSHVLPFRETARSTRIDPPLLLTWGLRLPQAGDAVADEQ